MSMTNIELGNYLCKVRKSLDLSTHDVNRLCGISQSYLSLIENGKRKASAIILKKLAPIYHLDYLELYKKAGYIDLVKESALENKLNKLNTYIEEANLSSLKILPVYGIIKAGEPSWAEQNIIAYIPFDSSLDEYSDTADYFYLKVDGESMNQVIKNGDYALIQKQSVANDGDIIVALVNGYDATLKKFKRLNNQFVLLEPMSTDTNIESITVDLKTTSFQILGKFVGYFGVYKK